MNDEQRKQVQEIVSMATDKNTKYRLGWGSIFVLMAAAGFADLVSLIPFAGDVVSPIYWFCVAGFLYLKGFGLMNPGRLATQLVGFAAELIPVVQEFPVFLLATALLIILTRVEDKTGIKANFSGRNLNDPATMNRNGVRLPSGQNQPLNSGGMRQPSGSRDTSDQEPTVPRTQDERGQGGVMALGEEIPEEDPLKPATKAPMATENSDMANKAGKSSTSNGISTGGAPGSASSGGASGSGGGGGGGSGGGGGGGEGGK